MKKIVIAVLIAAAAGAAYAACRTYSIIGPDGRFIVCTECCTGSVCNVICN